MHYFAHSYRIVHSWFDRFPVQIFLSKQWRACSGKFSDWQREIPTHSCQQERRDIPQFPSNEPILARKHSCWQERAVTTGRTRSRCRAFQQESETRTGRKFQRRLVQAELSDPRGVFVEEVVSKLPDVHGEVGIFSPPAQLHRNCTTRRRKFCVIQHRLSFEFYSGAAAPHHVAPQRGGEEREESRSFRCLVLSLRGW